MQHLKHIGAHKRGNLLNPLVDSLQNNKSIQSLLAATFLEYSVNDLSFSKKDETKCVTYNGRWSA